MNPELIKRFATDLQVMGIVISPKQEQMFERYYTLLVEWNEKMNLTAITEKEEVYYKHFYDSLCLVRIVDMDNISTLIDIGTGAGFPGLPLKILFPKVQITLLDSLSKRTKFLNKVIEELQLDNITTIHGRAEDFAKQKDYREQYDICVSRAVANLSTLSEYCLAFVKKEGYFVSYKSIDIDDEMKSAENAIEILGGKIDRIEQFYYQNNEIGRLLVKIKKVEATPLKYPRKSGIPEKKPL